MKNTNKIKPIVTQQPYTNIEDELSQIIIEYAKDKKEDEEDIKITETPHFIELSPVKIEPTKAPQKPVKTVANKSLWRSAGRRR